MATRPARSSARSACSPSYAPSAHVRVFNNADAPLNYGFSFPVSLVPVSAAPPFVARACSRVDSACGVSSCVYSFLPSSSCGVVKCFFVSRFHFLSLAGDPCVAYPPSNPISSNARLLRLLLPRLPVNHSAVCAHHVLILVRAKAAYPVCECPRRQLVSFGTLRIGMNPQVVPH